jgi:fluoride exporter
VQLLAIALGGALGAVSRYLSVIAIGNLAGVTFPWGTLTVNVVGSFLMGILVVLFDTLNWVPVNIKLMLTIGFLGSFTTFSTFSMDTLRLFEGGETSHALLYMAASLLLTVAACALGLILARGFVS